VVGNERGGCSGGQAFWLLSLLAKLVCTVEGASLAMVYVLIAAVDGR